MEADMGNRLIGQDLGRQTRQEVAVEGKQKKHELLGRKGLYGQVKLRALSQRHLNILGMHLTGDWTGVEIAQALGCSASHVYTVINDPLSQKIMNQFREGQYKDLEALMPKVIAAVKGGLTSSDTRTQLLAVDRFHKLTTRPEEKGQTNVTVNVITDARERFVEAIRDITPQEPLDGGDPTSPAKDLLEADSSETTSE